MANPLEIQAVVEHEETKFTLQPLLQRTQPILHNLIHRATLHTDQMMMVMMRTIIA
jgi:hypothetical protein